MKKPLRIAVAQINPTVGDIGSNRDKIGECIEKAVSKSADIVIFPELAICGYPPEDLLLKPHFIRDNVQAVRSLETKTKGITVICGFADIDGNGNVYNAAAVMSGGELKGVYHKKELPNYGVFDERRYFKAGRNNIVFTLGDILFGVTICEDIWVDKGPWLDQAKSGAKVLLNISASPFYAGKTDERRKLLAGRAKETGAYIFYGNLVGGQDELVFDGGSFVVDPRGKVIASGKEFEEDMVVVDINTEDIICSGKKRGVETKVRKVRLGRGESGEKSVLKNTVCPRLSRIEEIYKALVLGTGDYVRKNGFEKVVLGLSGGIDSSFTAAVAVDALGAENVIGVSMPSEYTSEGTRSDAGLTAQNLGMEFMEFPIHDVFQAYLNTLAPVFKGTQTGLAEENLQARIRAGILMALSNKFGWLVLTTGNKSETAMGYCTLYGDMAGGFAVIKDVPKTLVYELSRFLNDMKNKEIIPESVIKREPTAELRHGQKDTDSLPPYDILDVVLKHYVEEDESFDGILKKKIDRELVKKVMNMVDKSEYKRRQSAPGVKITPKAFGRDRRLPITNRYKPT